jgi:hypothetical protein
VLPGLHWIGMIRRGGDRGTVLRNLAGLAAIVALMVVLTRVSMAVSPRPPFVIAGLAINPHAAMDRDRLRRVRDRQSGAGDAAVRSAGAPRDRRSPTLIMAIAVGTLQSAINYGMMAFNPSS